MNAARRKEIRAIIDILEEQKVAIEEARDAEDEAFSNLPEALQDTEKGIIMMDNVDQLNEAIDGIEIAIDALLGATGT